MVIVYYLKYYLKLTITSIDSITDYKKTNLKFLRHKYFGILIFNISTKRQTRPNDHNYNNY